MCLITTDHSGKSFQIYRFVQFENLSQNNVPKKDQIMSLSFNVYKYT